MQPRTTQSNRTKGTFLRRGLFLSLQVTLFLGLCSLNSNSSEAQTVQTANQKLQGSSVSQALQRHGDITLRNSSLEGALFTISDLWGVNIVSGGIEGSVNGVFKNAPLREILDSILLSNGYGYRQVGDSILVSPLEQLGQVNTFFISETIPVGVSDVNEVVAAVSLLNTPNGKTQALSAARAILVVDFPDRIEKIRELVKQIDAATRGIGSPGGSLAPQKLEVAYFKTHYIPADKATQALEVILSTEGRTSAMDDEDRLLIVDYAENIQMAEFVLARIDRPRPQVNIKALIYDISLDDIEEIGVNWNMLSSGEADADGVPISGSGLAVDALTKAPFDAGSAGSSFTFFSLESDFSLEAVVRALHQATDSRLLASPNVTVLDNERASIESVSEIPFQQLTQTSAGGQIGTTSFKEAGIKLGVLPKIAQDGTIDMTVEPEFSSLVGFTPGDNQPIIDKRKATTRVRVDNGQTLMIAGLRQRNDVGDFNGIPHLKDARFFGNLFRARETQITESELVVFLTPEVVGYHGLHGERERLTADTVRCRLDRIPAAEGCPDCDVGCYPSSECESCHSGTVMPVPASKDVYVEQVEPLEQPILAPQPTSSKTLPEVPNPTQSSAKATPKVNQNLRPQKPIYEAQLQYPVLTKSQPRRLPPIDRELDNAILPITVASDEEEEKPLRIDYDSRFRAKGEVYQSEKKVATKPEPESEQKSWTDRLLLR